jgi:hypothetical protein
MAIDPLLAPRFHASLRAMGPFRGRCLAAAIYLISAGIVVLSAGFARAQDSAAGEEGPATRSARTYFREGTERARSGDWSRALEAFERSSALRPHPVTTYDIGYCERALGRMTRARKMFQRALAEGSESASEDARLPSELAAAARFYLAEVEHRVARAIVRVSPADASIQIDGRPLEQAVAADGRPAFWAGTHELGPGEPAPGSPFVVELDPGTHVVVLSRAGHPDEVSTRSVPEGAETQWMLRASPAVDESSAARTRDLGIEAKPGPWSWHTTRGLALRVAIGAAIAGLGTGAVAGAISWMQKSKVTTECSLSHACTTDAGRLYLARANTAADVATAGLAVGAVAAGTAVAIAWFARPRAVPSGRLVPWVAPQAAGIAGWF